MKLKSLSTQFIYLLSALFFRTCVRLRDEFFLELFIFHQNFLRPKNCGSFYALISTSTPEGKSSLLKASTVLEEEV